MYSQIISDLQALANPEKAEFLKSFFKTKPGQYAAGDVMLGISVPDQRIIASKYVREVSLTEIGQLLAAVEHEYRLTGLLLLVYKYKKTKSQGEKKAIFDFYLAHKNRVNNWDLVDSSAHKIVGDYLYNYKEDRNLLYELAKSDNLWDRRIALLSTFYFIGKEDFVDSLKLAEIMLGDEQDLIHKASGWMLREIGKKDLPVLLDFLEAHSKVMPRTMLRYAIEKLEPSLRIKYMEK